MMPPLCLQNLSKTNRRMSPLVLIFLPMLSLLVMPAHWLIIELHLLTSLSLAHFVENHVVYIVYCVGKILSKI